MGSNGTKFFFNHKTDLSSAATNILKSKGLTRIHIKKIVLCLTYTAALIKLFTRFRYRPCFRKVEFISGEKYYFTPYVIFSKFCSGEKYFLRTIFLCGRKRSREKCSQSKHDGIIKNEITFFASAIHFKFYQKVKSIILKNKGEGLDASLNGTSFYIREYFISSFINYVISFILCFSSIYKLRLRESLFFHVQRMQ